MTNRVILNIPVDFLFIHEPGFEVLTKIRMTNCQAPKEWINDWLTYDKKLGGFKLRNRPRLLLQVKPEDVIKVEDLFQIVMPEMTITFRALG